MKKKYIPVSMLLLAAAALAQSGCTNPRWLSSQADSRYSPVKVADWINPPPQGETRTIRVLMVHGMGDHPFGMVKNETYTPNLLGHATYSGLITDMEHRRKGTQAWNDMANAAVGYEYSEFISAAAGRLGKFTECPEHEFDLVWDPPHENVIGYMFTTTYEPAKNGDVRLKFYVMNWSVAGVKIKEARFGSWGLLNSDNPEKDGYIAGDVGEFEKDLNANRQLLNKYLKLRVMDWGLGDAVLYLGATGDNYRRVVATQMNALAREARPNDRLAIVSDSLGSTIALDTLLDFLGPRKDFAWDVDATRHMKYLFQTAKNEVKSKQPGDYDHARATFYMCANQYALLKMGANSRGMKGPGDSFVKLDSVLRDKTDLEEQKAVFQVYAFTDPNDLLSYPLNLPARTISSCNVYVHNSGLNLGIIAEPGEVHVNYEKNDAVIDAILNGPRDVKLPPK